MECNDLKLSKYLDNELTEPERAELEEHLKTCPACQEKLSEWKANDETFRSAIKGVVNKDLPARLAERVKSATTRFGGRRRIMRPVMKFAIAALVLLAVGIGIYQVYQLSKSTPPSPEQIRTTGPETRPPMSYPPVGKGTLEARVFAQKELLSGTKAGLRLVTVNYKDETPLAGIGVSVNLADPKEKKEYPLYEGMTDLNGTLLCCFDVPDLPEGTYEMNIKAKAKDDEQYLKYEVKLKKVYNIYLTTDKPIYQPSQIMHIRALALRKDSLLPLARMPITLEVEDSKGNKVMKKINKTDKFGLSSATFSLANEINLGAYTVRAILADNPPVEKKVTVDRYVLPKFKIDFSTDKKYYLPKEKVKCSLRADYFYGKPVANAQVEVKAFTFDTRFREFGKWTGKTDQEGATPEFSFTLPNYFVGQPLLQGKGLVKLEINITDETKHLETLTHNITVSEGTINITVIPESGSLVPSVENIIYIGANYPDGSPAPKTTLNIEIPLQKETIKVTDELGIAQISLTPKTKELKLKIQAQDQKGNKSEKTFSAQFDQIEEGLLIRTNKGIYKVGETLGLTVLSTQPSGPVFVDIIKDRQTVLTKTIELQKGKATLELEISNDLFGTLEIHAYQMRKLLNIIRDSCRVFVTPAKDLVIDIQLDKATYKPAEEATLNFVVKDATTKHPVLAALGVWVVDEAVFAKSELQPGLAKVFFFLEKEIMQPRYEIHEYSFPEIAFPAPAPQPKPKIAQRRQEAAQVLLAATEEINSLPIRLSSREEELKEEILTRVRKICAAIKKYYAAGNRLKQPYRENLFPELVLKGFLKEAAVLLDPWGNQFIPDPSDGCGCNDNFPHDRDFISLGPDEKRGTDDDIYARGPGARDAGGELCELRRSLTALMEAGQASRRGIPVLQGIPIIGALYTDRTEAEGKPKAPSGVPRAKSFLREEWKDEERYGGEVISGALPEIRLREFFPETLFVNPALITDRFGRAQQTFRLADSITTWRLSAFASSLKGKLGSTTKGIRVFQDFFIDIDLPVYLTQQDEVSIPVMIHNYLDKPQDVRLKVKKEDWFELLDEPEKTIEMKPESGAVVYFRIRAKGVGLKQRFEVEARDLATGLGDRVARTVEVKPDGEEVLINFSDRLDGKLEQVINIPENAINNASTIFVKLYPGIFSQVVEGIEKLMRMPHGCFEQTTSVTYPNVLALDYLKKTKQSTPEIEMKALTFINHGYQRQLSFEVPGGGFEWYGRPPANQLLTAYGLMAFADMAKVFDQVDPKVIARTQNWLVSRQQPSGAWKPDQKEQVHAAAWQAIKNKELLVTAYITWSLAETDYKGEALNKAINYIKNSSGFEQIDPYTLGLAANALLAADPKDKVAFDILKTLEGIKQESGPSAVYWKGVSTMSYSTGNAADIETTAIISLALMKAKTYHQTLHRALTWLVQSKDPHGTWHSTQGTILALKALLGSQPASMEPINAEVSINLNNNPVGKSEIITPDDWEVVRTVDLRNLVSKGEHRIGLHFAGQGQMMYQLVGRYYVPVTEPPIPETEPFTIEVNYDRTKLVQEDIVKCNVKVTNNREGIAKMVIVDLAIPPGFKLLDPGELAELVGMKRIARYTLTARQLILYFDQVEGGKPVELFYHLKAKYPVKAKIIASRIYEYYNTEQESFSQPGQIEVEEKGK